MSDEQNTDGKKTLSLGAGKTLSLSGSGATKAKQALNPGRGGIAVEVRRARRHGEGESPAVAPVASPVRSNTPVEDTTSNDEKEARLRALQRAREAESNRPLPSHKQPYQPIGLASLAQKEEEEKRRTAELAAATAAAATTPAAPPRAKNAREAEVEEMERIEAEETAKAAATRKAHEATARNNAGPAARTGGMGGARTIGQAQATLGARRPAGAGPPRGPGGVRPGEEETMRERLKRASATRRTGEEEDTSDSFRRLTVTQVLNEDYERADRTASLAAIKRARAKARASMGMQDAQVKITRDVILPETITVQELANRMAERGVDVIKCLMRMGVMSTINQPIDADTAELVISEFGHKAKRVTEGDVEEGIEGDIDNDTNLMTRPPVVTIMGHVDHGKTSLLDALRQTDVVSGEAGGITQHIGAYQITRPSGQKITFLDTPGHAAFTEMRARGANVTDIVVLVVAANDSIMPQTIEAIRHARAANVPIIVAVNKIDLPDANPLKVKQDLLQHEVMVEEMGGETLCIEVSAKKRINLDKLEEAILLQSEILDLKANPNRDAVGTVVEAKLEQGRGSVATVLVEKGTLRVGDIFVVGSESGRVRALMNDRGESIVSAVPGQPVEVLGLSGTPQAGDRMVVVESDAKAREIVDYRQRKRRDTTAASNTQTFDQLLKQARDGSRKQLPIIAKADVHGSVEAIAGALTKITQDNTELELRVLHSGVGGITESDVTLAKASGAIIIGFNVRANAQARELAKRDGVDIRYYNIIYNIIDDMRAILGGMLAPTVREEYLGQAQVRQVFNITKVGKVAGCMVTNGSVKRGSKVRLLRDDVVIHEGMLKTLKRFKDEVKDVREGMECGMAFENYEDVRDGDIIECFDVVSETRTLA
ncbi:MAG: translation initiation factor IF-2 [Pseudomonadota bacterium]